MLRIISRMDVKSNRLIKSIKLEGLRDVGDPILKAEQYYMSGADEIFVNDPVASLYGMENLTKMLQKITEQVFIPVCASGGISSVDDVYKIFDQGADKVALNSALFKNKKLLNDLIKIFGSQSIVGSVEIKRIEKNKWEAYYHNGRERSHVDAFEWIKLLQAEGVGELMITSIDQEGTKKGFDLDFLDQFKEKTQVPTIIGGGINSAKDIKDCMLHKDIDGVSIAGFFHYGKGTIKSLKKDLKEDFDVSVREF